MEIKMKVQVVMTLLDIYKKIIFVLVFLPLPLHYYHFQNLIQLLRAFMLDAKKAMHRMIHHFLHLSI